MATENKTLKEVLLQFLGNKKSVNGAPKFVIKASGKMKADVSITDQAGVGYFIDNDAVTEVMQASGSPIFLANPDGTPTTTPAPDGDITTTDGLVVSVQGGKVTAVKQGQAPAALTTQQLTAKIVELEKGTSEIKAGIAAIADALKANQTAKPLTEAEINSKLEELVKALKNEISSNHVPQRTKAERRKVETEGLQKMGPLALKMRYPHGIPADVAKTLNGE